MNFDNPSSDWNPRFLKYLEELAYDLNNLSTDADNYYELSAGFSPWIKNKIQECLKFYGIEEGTDLRLLYDFLQINKDYPIRAPNDIFDNFLGINK